MQTFTLKSGTNKGNRRIWIEGNRLLDCGLVKGTALYRTMHDDGMVLTTAPSTSRDPKAKRHTVSGKGTGHPVLDLSGKWVSDFVGDHTHFKVTPIDNGHGVDLIIAPVTI